MYRLLDKSEPLQSGDEVLPLGIHYAWVPVVESGFGNKNWNAVVRRKIDNSSPIKYINDCDIIQDSGCAKCIGRTWDAARLGGGS